ncbi:hypothetical protein BZA05DRAFT_107227 [Tricharina praecox]|uniref:uncharacterized protein n=1 Tax=Tricharina praecox TaxID=43433 RepID=UPI00221FACC2|nr:uncharacterized protein BZA05DRAFT_107227 [Tricharina praecox]KAI5857820.1 hypothetical protein BZA05DRAFT_107227 [Tricharina praecox]
MDGWISFARSTDRYFTTTTIYIRQKFGFYTLLYPLYVFFFSSFPVCGPMRNRDSLQGCRCFVCMYEFAFVAWWMRREGYMRPIAGALR